MHQSRQCEPKIFGISILQNACMLCAGEWDDNSPECPLLYLGNIGIRLSARKTDFAPLEHVIVTFDWLVA